MSRWGASGLWQIDALRLEEARRSLEHIDEQWGDTLRRLKAAAES